MNIKEGIGAVFLAGAAITGNAQTTGVQNTISGQTDAVMSGKNNLGNLQFSPIAGISIQGATDSRFGQGGAVTIETGDREIAAGIHAERLDYAQELLVSAGIQINKNTTFSLGYAQREEDADRALDRQDKGNVKLHGSQSFLRIDMSGLGNILDRAAISYIIGQSDKSHLATRTSSSTSIQSIDFDTFSRAITSYYSNREDTYFSGGDWKKLLFAGTVLVGENGEVTVRLGTSQGTILGNTETSTFGGVTYKHYGQGWIVAGSIDTLGAGMNQATIGVKKALNKNWSAVVQASTTTGGVGGANHRVFAGLEYAFGGNRAEYIRPGKSESLGAREITRDNLNNPNYRMPTLASTGVVYREITTTQTGANSVDTAKTPDALPTPSVTIDENGNVTLGLRVGGASMRAQAALPTRADYTYECSINGGTAFDCTSGKISADHFDFAKTNTLSIVVINTTIPGQVKRSAPTVLPINFSKDNPTITLPPTQVGPAETNLLRCRVNLADLDGISDLKCVFQTADGRTYPAAFSEGSVYTITGLPAGTAGYLVSSGLATVVLPNGTKKIQYVETRTRADTIDDIVTPPVVCPPGYVLDPLTGECV